MESQRRTGEGLAPSLLEGYRAIDLTTEAGQLCGRFLADLGMEVVKIEPPGGDPVRGLGPFMDVPDGQPRSLRFEHLNAGKKSVILDHRDAKERDRLKQLIAESDVVLESFEPGHLATLGLGYQDLAAINPRLVMASITGFGQTGPRRGAAYTDMTVYAMSGLMYMNGEAGGVPCKPPESQAYYFGGLGGALGVLAALHGREQSGRGDWIDVSMQEILATQEHLIRVYAMEGQILRRQGNKHGHVAPGKVFPCRDGYAYFYMNRNHWVRFLEFWKDHPKELDDPALLAEPVRYAKADFIHEKLEAFTRQYTKDELTRIMQDNRICCAPVNTPGDWLSDPHLLSRGFMPPPGPSGDVQAAGTPYLLNGKRPPVGKAPRPGEHQGDQFIKRRDDRQTSKEAASAASVPPLTGMRILSFDQIIAGPYGTTLLADLGAEILKVESKQGGLDMFRFFGKTQDPNQSPRFLEFNRNKRSLTINLKSAEGPALIKALSEKCDAVLDNYSVHVMPSLGLDHEALKAVKPGVVTMRMPGLGCTGPKNEYATVGTIINAITGFIYLWNHEGEVDPPIGSATVLPDYASGIIAAALLIASKLHNKRTGEGVFIDVSQGEVASYLLGVSLLQANYSKEPPEPMGNTSLDMAPHGCYPAHGSDRWCVIAVENDAQWQALAAAMGQPQLVQDPRFGTLAARITNRSALDSIVGAWTAGQDAHAVMERLQTDGIPCGAVQTGADLVSDPHLRARDYVVGVDDARLGRVTMPDFPIRFANSAINTNWGFPMLGTDNHAVCADLLGYSSARIEQLEKDRVLY
jgi:crotonobetainyl-CoA:carnitine CoA-transferase CaiB-like acyl-CoA transferase